MARSVPNVLNLLKESATKVLNENAGPVNNGKATWSAPLHFVWSRLAKYFGNLGQAGRKDLASIWTPVVEGKDAVDLNYSSIEVELTWAARLSLCEECHGFAEGSRLFNIPTHAYRSGDRRSPRQHYFQP
jgi:hypothetical protein